MLNLIDRHLKIPKYLQLAEHLRQEIGEGRLLPGERLPSFTEMRSEFEASQGTIEKAHALLEADGLIRREPGRGIFVNQPVIRKVTDVVAFFDNKTARNHPYHQEIQQGVREQAALQGKSIIIMDDPVTFKHWDIIDGVVMEDVGRYPLQALSNVPSQGLPIVRLLYQDPAGSSVIADDAAGIAMAVEHLVGLGHQRIGYLGNIVQGQPLLQHRHPPYIEALAKHGVTSLPEWTFSYSKYTDADFYDYSDRAIQFNNFDFRDYGYVAMQTWLKRGWSELNLTAILAQNDYCAIGMMRALKENNIRVPQDVSIVGYDGAGFPSYDSLRLTTVEVPLREMGATAMKVLAEHINSPSHEREVIKLPVRLFIGESTSVPRENL